MMTITKEQVLQALGHVEEPDLKKDLVTLNMIQDIQIEGNKVSFSVILTTPACPLKAMIENACRNAILHFISKEADIHINMTSRVTTQKNTGVPGVKNIIAVASGKGGVGKSTTAGIFNTIYWLSWNLKILCIGVEPTSNNDCVSASFCVHSELCVPQKIQEGVVMG
jgi:metal-sulfur cluster biosynthetic enzyme